MTNHISQISDLSPNLDINQVASFFFLQIRPWVLETGKHLLYSGAHDEIPVVFLVQKP